jgi:RHS repeat-associated protein
MPPKSAPNQIPAIRPTQFENSNADSLKNSVNLFRGDVNFQKTLVTLPGKFDDSTLQIQINILYESNVSQEVTTWNLDAPTGVLGLGWSLSGESITANSNGALSQSSLQYVYQSGGTSNQLYGNNDVWARGFLNPALAAYLNSEITPPQMQEIVAAFANVGLLLDVSATIQTNGDNEWILDDAVNQHLWNLSLITEKGKEALQVADGGQSFELQSYQFWKIFYYPKYERWEITDNSGALKIFGGGIAQTSDGYNISNGNSIEWGVKWDSNGSWNGSSLVSGNQTQYAVAWNLYSKVDRYGDSISYEYNGFERVGGLISMGAEQLVSEGGKPYTKACYPTSATDAFGRRVVFNYKYKTFTGAAQEYIDPHFVLTPAASNNTAPENLNTPTGFQDCYEVLLLENLEVQAPDEANNDELVFGISFNYTDPENISTTPPEMQTVMCKSYLQEITWYNSANITLPGYVCDYYLDSSEGTANLGSVKSITYPEGSTGTFTYGTNKLPVCDRTQIITPPDTMNAGDVLESVEDALALVPAIKNIGAQPRVWFGEDYAVTVWISQDLTQVSLEVHTWVGHWAKWSPPDILIFNEEGNFVDPTSFEVITNQNAFVLSFNSKNYTCLYPFNRNPQQTSQWEPIDYNGSTRKTFAEVNAISFAAGNEFVLALVNTGTNNPSYSLYCFTFNWREINNPWSGFDNPLADYDSLATPLFMLAQNEYYLVLTYDKASESTLRIYYLDQFGKWNTGGQATHNLDLTYNDGQMMMWSAGASCAAFTVAQTSWSSFNNYTLTVFRWDADYNFCYSQNFTDLQASPLHEMENNPVWSPSPRIIGNEIVGCAGTVCRFNGSDWDTYTFPPPIGSGDWLKYAYGQDFTLQVVNSGSEIETSLLPYDPQGEGFASSPQQTVYNQGVIQKYMGYPSASGEDYFCAANGIFYRGSSTSWDNAFASPVYALDEQIDTVSLINESPNFTAYRVPGYAAENTEIQLLILQNGGVTVSDDNILKHENFFTLTSSSGQNSSPAGQFPAGESALATFPARYGQFQDSPFFILHRYAGFQLKGEISDYPVESLKITIFGEDETISTCYEYNAASAACDASGEIVKYYQSTSYNGCDDPSLSAFGRTVNIYYNGITEGYSMLDGQSIQTIMFEGAALFSTRWQEDLGLDPAQPPAQDPTPVALPLATLFEQNGTPLSPSATIQYLKIGKKTEGYCYWQIEDAENKAAYNLDYNDNPESPDGVKVFTGRCVQYSANDWKVFDKRNGNPHTPAPVQLHGAYALPVGQTTFQDGVGLTTAYGYRSAISEIANQQTIPENNLLPFPFTGGVQQQVWSYHNVEGERESYIQEATFGAQVYPPLVWANVLTPTAQLRTVMRKEKSDWLTIASTANTFSEWVSTEGLSICDTKNQYAWKGDPSGNDTGQFPFGKPSPDLWSLQNQTTVRNGGGVVTESVDATGLTHSTILDKDSKAEIAIVSNASYENDEAAFCGFEDYENIAGWTLSGGAQITNDNAHTGTQSLYLPVGSAANFAALTPARNERMYIFSCWYQVDSISTEAGAAIQITQDGIPVGDAINVAFNASTENWSYAHTAIDLAAYQKQATGSGSLSIEISLQTNAADGVWVDDVSFAPKACSFTAQVHDPLTSQTTAKLSLNGKTFRMLYDSCSRLMGTVGAGERLRGLKTVYYSRQGNPNGFNLSDPNANLKVKAQHGGSAQTFRNGNNWQNDWTPDEATAWTTNNGLLVHAASGASNTLTSASPVDRDFAVYFDLFDSTGKVFKASDGLALKIGNAASIAWNGEVWTLNINGNSFASLCVLASPPTQILLMLTGDNLIFYSNGQLVFSQTASVTGVPQIVTGNNGVSFRNLIFLISPSLQLSQQDEAGNDRQKHVMAGNDYFINQLIGDSVANRSIKTKAIPGSARKDVNLPALQYCSTLVDLAAFQNTVNTTGLMSGDVADYYNGSNGATNDESYPYSRYRYEASPLNRVAEVGSPGAGYAIIENTPFEQRQTVRLIRSPNEKITLPDALTIPAGQYRVTTRLDQTNKPSLTIKDAVSNKVATVSGSKEQWVINTTGVTYGTDGAETRIALPNSFLEGAVKQLLVKQYNGLGQLVSESDPDTGTTNYIYNSRGQARFVQGSEGAKNGFAVYLLYDELGRRVARGFLQTGDFASLQSYADSLTFPEKNDENVSYQALNVWLYDGDGKDVNALGNLVKAISYNNGTATVTEERIWNRQGLVKSKTLKTEWTDDGSVDGPFTLDYEYDAQGNLTYLGYPDLAGVSLKAAIYAYDAMAQIETITDQDGNVLASYRFNANGQAAALKLSARQIAGGFGYDSPGHFCDIQAASNQAGFSTSAVYNPDGSVNTQNDDFENAGTLSGDYDLSFAYALQNQLASTISAEPSLQQTFGYINPATNAPDLNGNLHTIQPSGDTFIYETANQLSQIEWGAGGTTSFVYNDNGTVQSRTSQGAGSLPDLQFSYLPGTTLPASITLASGNVVKYVYDSNGTRMGKRIYDGDTVSSAIKYVPGPLKPFAQIDQTGNAVAYVYGVNGLIAMFRDNQAYSVITDRLGSTRMVFDAAGSVTAAYNFQTYGSVAQSFEPSSGWMPLLFTGQEFDSETGLYNFNARLYDAVSGRFCQPDPVQQYPSPYIYTGNHPNIFTDPTGMITQAGQEGLAAVLVLGYAIGFGLTFLLAPEDSPLLAIGLYALSGAITGFSSAGLTYDVEHNPSDWNRKQFFEVLAIGTITGAAGGAITGGVSQIGVRKAAKTASAQASENIIDSGAGDVLEDSVQNHAMRETNETIKSRASKSWEKEKSSFLYKLGGRLGGYTVSGFTYTIGTNLVYYGNVGSAGSIIFWTGFSIVEGLGATLLSVAGGVAEDTFQISSAVKEGASNLGSWALREPEYAIYGLMGMTTTYMVGAGGAFVVSNNVYNAVMSEFGSSNSSN